MIRRDSPFVSLRLLYMTNMLVILVATKKASPMTTLTIDLEGAFARAMEVKHGSPA